MLLRDQANLAPDRPTTNFETLLIDNRATIGANQIADFNTISGEGGSSGSIFTLYGAAPGVFDFSGKTVDSRIHFIGSRGNDTITGSSGNDWLNGGSSGVEHFTIVANATLTASDYTFV